jgi:hypothetical protein
MSSNPLELTSGLRFGALGGAEVLAQRVRFLRARLQSRLRPLQVLLQHPRALLVHTSTLSTRVARRERRGPAP